MPKEIELQKTVAVVDDENDILELVSLHLKKSNFLVRDFVNAQGLMKYLASNVPDCIVLDLMLPDGDGFEICKKIRRDERLAAVPLIMLTAKSDESDKVFGLELGADDYVTKPFSPKELVARVKAVLRRGDAKQRESKKRVIDDIEIDLEKMEVSVRGAAVALTTTEFRILTILSEYRGWVCSRDKMLDQLWGHDKVISDRTIDVHIKNIREKLGGAGDCIVNIRGVGYKIREQKTVRRRST